MPRNPTNHADPRAPAAKAPPTKAHNPRDLSEPQLAGTPPQPKVPEQSSIEPKQEHQPVIPAPLIGQAPNPSRGTREEKNG